jgi:hypothetical protein
VDIQFVKAGHPFVAVALVPVIDAGSGRIV